MHDEEPVCEFVSARYRVYAIQFPPFCTQLLALINNKIL